MPLVKALNRAKRASAALFFALGFGSANWLARIPAVRRTLDLNDRDLGLVLLASGVGALLAFRTAGFFLKRIQAKQLATVSTCLFALFLFVPAAVRSAYAAAATLFVSGYFSGMMDISLNTHAVEVEKRLQRPILAAMHGYCSLGGFCGAACGALAAWYDIAPVPHLLGVAAVMVPGAWWTGRDMLEEQRVEDAQPQKVVYTAALVLLGVVAFCSSVGEGAMSQWTAVYLRDELHTSMGLAGFGYAAYSAAMVIGRLLGDRVSGHWPAHTVLMSCGLLAGLSLAVGLVVNTPTVLIFALVGVGAGLSLVIPVVLRCAVHLPRMPSSGALSAVATLSYGGFLFGPPTIGLLGESLGLRAALCVVVALCLTLAALGARVHTRSDKQQDIPHV